MYLKCPWPIFDGQNLPLKHQEFNNVYIKYLTSILCQLKSITPNLFNMINLPYVIDLFEANCYIYITLLRWACKILQEGFSLIRTYDINRQILLNP